MERFQLEADSVVDMKESRMPRGTFSDDLSRTIATMANIVNNAERLFTRI